MIGEAISFKAAAMLGRLANLDSGSGNARLECYATTRPATGASPGGSALAVITLTKPAGTVDGDTGTLTLTQDGDGLVYITGVVQWCRVKNGNSEFCFDLDAAEVGSPEEGDAEAIFDDTQLYAGGGARLVSCVLGG